LTTDPLQAPEETATPPPEGKGLASSGQVQFADPLESSLDNDNPPGTPDEFPEATPDLLSPVGCSSQGAGSPRPAARVSSAAWLLEQEEKLNQSSKLEIRLSEFAVFQTSPPEEDRLDLEATALRSATNYCPHCGIKNAHGAAAKACHDCGARFAKPLNLAA
jgi:hypothetical protein